MIKECPFCGSEGAPRRLKPSPFVADWTWAVVCQDLECAAVGPSTDTEQKAVGLWNTRSDR